MRKKIIYLIIMGFLVQQAALAEFVPFGPATGSSSQKNLQLLQQQEFIKQEKEDFKQVQERNKKEDKKKKEEKKQVDKAKKKTPVKRAKASEYATKGVYIEKFIIPDSQILSKSEMDEIFGPLTETNVHFEQIKDAVQQINIMYAKKGYVTARAFLPVQKIKSGIVRIDLIEGRVGKFNVENNKWTKTSFVEKRMTQKPNELFDIVKLEQDIVAFNRYNSGVSLKASLYPGKADGTTDITLEAQETFPFRVTGLFDNAGRHTIGELRGGVMAQADSLLGYRDKLTLGTYMSKSSVTPFVDYNVPVNKYDGRVGFNFSSSNSTIIDGPFQMFNIQSRSYNYSLYYTHPLVRKPKFELSAYAAANYKQATTSFDGHDLYTDQISAAQLALNGRYDSKRGIWYGFQDFYHAFPIMQEASRYFKYSGGITRLHDFGHGVIAQLRGNYQFVPQDVIPYVDQFQSGGIATVRGYSEGLLVGKSGYFLSAELLFPILPSEITIKVKDKNEKAEGVVDIASQNQGEARLMAALDEDKKIKNSSSSLNYVSQEGFDPNTSNNIVKLNIKNPKPSNVKTRTVPFLGKYVKGIVFVDHAGVLPFKGEGPGVQPYDANDFLASAGMGLRVELPADLTARLYWGFPLINNSHEQYTTRANWGRFHFELSLTPDIEKLLKLKKSREAL